MLQSLTPDEIEILEFHRSFRGYARDEVRDLLGTVAQAIRELESKAESGYLALGEKMGELLQKAKEEADDLVAAGTAEAKRITDEARSASDQIRSEAGGDASSIVSTAEDHAAKIVTEAENRLAELRKDEDEIRSGLTALRAEVEAVVTRLRPLENDRTAAEGVTEELSVDLSSELEDAER